MIDAVAKALAGWAVPANDWDRLAESQREAWRAGARAAIEAMRHPTESMTDAGVDSVLQERERHRQAQQKARGWSYNEADICWHAMIAAALTPADG